MRIKDEAEAEVEERGRPSFRLYGAFTLATALLFLNFSAGSVPLNSRNYQQITVISAVAPSFEGVRAVLNETEHVVIEVEIDRMGVGISSRPLHGHPVLQILAERAARRWRFVPGGENDKARVVQLEFVFRLMPAGTPKEELTPIYIPPYKVEVRHLPFSKRCC